MTIATILPEPRTVFLDTNNNPLSGGFVYSYVPNTATLKTTWQDANGVTSNANPITLDGQGSCLLYGSGQYTLEVYDSNNNLIYTGLSQDTYGLITNGNNTFTGLNTFTNTVTFTQGLVLPSDFVTNAMLANMPANTVKVNDTNSIAAPTDLVLTTSTLLGRGSTGSIAVISLGTGLSISGTTLNGYSPESNQQSFASSGTWTPPSGYGPTAPVLIECWGGGGGAGYANGGGAGGGGGGGSYKYAWQQLTNLGSSVTVTIGAGGAGGTNNQNGHNGGFTTFGTFVKAYGGVGGAENGNGGAGGGYASTAAAGTTQNDTGGEGWGGQYSSGTFTAYGGYFTGGGGGYTGVVGAPSVYGGGGGGGYSGNGGASQFGGNGGSGGGAGSVPGGGGAGEGGAGAAGQCRVTVFG